MLWARTRRASCSAQRVRSPDRASRGSRMEHAKAMARGSGRIFALALILAGAGCGMTPASGPLITSYDFGPPPEGRQVAGLRQALLVHDVSAPAWLDSPLIY